MLTVIDPTTGQELHALPAADAAERDQIIERATDAFDDWRRRSFAERGEVLQPSRRRCATTSNVSPRS